MAGGRWDDFVSDREGWQESVMMRADLHPPGQAWWGPAVRPAGSPVSGRSVSGAGARGPEDMVEIELPAGRPTVFLPLALGWSWALSGNWGDG